MIESKEDGGYMLKKGKRDFLDRNCVELAAGEIEKNGAGGLKNHLIEMSNYLECYMNVSSGEFLLVAVRSEPLGARFDSSLQSAPSLTLVQRGSRTLTSTSAMSLQEYPQEIHLILDLMNQTIY